MDMAELLASATGVRLAQAEYERDFGARLWLADGTDLWKLERLQHYDETGFPSWDAFAAGDWAAALRLINAERPGFTAFYREFARHRGAMRRVRIVEEPVSAYLQWEFHVLRVRAECGERCRVLDAARVDGLEAGRVLPDLVSLCGKTLYQVRYTDTGQPAGAIRFTDPGLIARYEEFAAALWESAEDVGAYFRRAIAPLPPPRPALARGGGPGMVRLRFQKLH
jgi:hypothetical protein